MNILDASKIMFNNRFDRLSDLDALTWYRDLKDFRVFVRCIFDFNNPDEIASFDLYLTRMINEKPLKIEVCNDRDIHFILRVIHTFQYSESVN